MTNWFKKMTPEESVQFNKKYMWPKIIVFFLFLIISFVTLDNFKVAWNPKDWFDEVVYLINIKTTPIPTEIPEAPKEVADLVDQRLMKPFYLILVDPEFNYLAEYAIINKIKLVVEPATLDNCKYACYHSLVGLCDKKTNPGWITVIPIMAENGNPSKIASILVHELTHAWNKFEESSRYCTETGERYLSDEFTAFKNEDSFYRQFNNRFTMLDYYDLQGVFHPYCLKQNIKNNPIYAGLIDDVDIPKPAGTESYLCFFHN